MRNIDVLLNKWREKKIKTNPYDDYYNGIMTIKDRSTPVMLDSNVRKNQTYGNNSSRSFKRFDRIYPYPKKDQPKKDHI